MKIMMVCLGNICRSPLAEGILQKKVDTRNLDWVVHSSGTSGFHNGNLPDSRSIEVANRHGVDITHQRSQLFVRNHIEEYDFILAMDESNYEDILFLCKSEQEKRKVQLILDYGPNPSIKNIPDPYFGHGDGFEQVYDMLDEVTDDFIQHILLAED